MAATPGLAVASPPARWVGAPGDVLSAYDRSVDVEAAAEYIRRDMGMLAESRSRFGDGMAQLMDEVTGGGARLSGIDVAIQRRLVPFSEIAIKDAPGGRCWQHLDGNST